MQTVRTESNCDAQLSRTAGPRPPMNRNHYESNEFTHPGNRHFGRGTRHRNVLSGFLTRRLKTYFRWQAFRHVTDETSFTRSLRTTRVSRSWTWEPRTAARERAWTRWTEPRVVGERNAEQTRLELVVRRRLPGKPRRATPANAEPPGIVLRKRFERAELSRTARRARTRTSQTLQPKTLVRRRARVRKHEQRWAGSRTRSEGGQQRPG